MEKAIGSNTRRTIILPSIHRWKVALRHAFLPSCFSRSSPGRTRFDRPGRVEEVLFSLSLSRALPLLPPTSGINPGARSAKVNALIKKLPQPTVIPNHSRSRSASRFKSARFSTRYFKSYSFSFLPILVFSMASKRGAIFFFKFNLKFEILFEDGKKGFEKIESKSWKILFDGGKRGYLILERIWNSLFWSKFDSWIWEEFESYKYCWLNESRLLYFFSYNLVSKFLETLEIQNACKT